MALAKLRKWNNDQGIKISKEILAELGIEGDKDVIFDIEVQQNKILLTPRVHLSPLEKLFVNYDSAENPPIPPYDWGKPEGKEIW